MRTGRIMEGETAVSETRLIKTSEKMSRDELADLLEQMAGRIRSGQLTLKSGTDEVLVEPAELVAVDVEVIKKDKRRGTTMELEIEIEWTPGDTGSGGLTLG